MQELMLALLLWVNQNTDIAYDPAAGLPNIELVEERELAVLIFDGKVPAFLSAEDLHNISAQIEAIYHPASRTIFVRKGLDLDTIYGKSAVVHELVHFVQYQQGHNHEVPCVNALELDAYDAQAVYLTQHGEAPRFDEFTVGLRSLCQPGF